jgi:hypothetical protein
MKSARMKKKRSQSKLNETLQQRVLKDNLPIWFWQGPIMSSRSQGQIPKLVRKIARTQPRNKKQMKHDDHT